MVNEWGTEIKTFKSNSVISLEDKLNAFKAQLSPGQLVCVGPLERITADLYFVSCEYRNVEQL